MRQDHGCVIHVFRTQHTPLTPSAHKILITACCFSSVQVVGAMAMLTILVVQDNWMVTTTGWSCAYAHMGPIAKRLILCRYLLTYPHIFLFVQK